MTDLNPRPLNPEELSVRDIHPSPFIEERVEDIRQRLTVMHYAMQGILRLDDHSELSDAHVAGALQRGSTVSSSRSCGSWKRWKPAPTGCARPVFSRFQRGAGNERHAEVSPSRRRA
jgi:hypothetical protein